MKRHLLWILVVAGLVTVTAAGVIAATNRASADTYAVADPSVQADPADQVAQAAPAPARAPAPDMRRRLNLTDEQARRVEQVMANFRNQTERLRIDLARAQLDAREVMLAATPDRGRLETISRRMGELQGQLIRARFEMMVELKTVLTAEQWARFQFMGRPGGMFPGRFRPR